MARKSRRAQNDTAVSTAVTANIQTKKKENLLRTAAYGRLSVENETDESLQTQMSMLYQFIDEHEDLQFEDSYSDNGYLFQSLICYVRWFCSLFISEC